MPTPEEWLATFTEAAKTAEKDLAAGIKADIAALKGDVAKGGTAPENTAAPNDTEKR